MPLDRAAGPSLLLCSVGKETFLTYLWQPQQFGFFFLILFYLIYLFFFFLGAKPSIPILWELTQEEML